MQFNDLLTAHGIKPAEVLILRHRPKEQRLRKILPWLALERPELFNAYQQSQYPKVEKAFTRAKYVASFVGLKAGEALFAGLYNVKKWKPISRKQFWSKSVNKELHDKFGMIGFNNNQRRSTLWFDLVLEKGFYDPWRGRLVVKWPGLERSWWRWGDRNTLLIDTISAKSAFEPEIPKWDEIVLTWVELATLPAQWRTAFQQWCGVYYIFDASDGRGYVGSAYGSDNLFGRWSQYAKSGHGGNKLLRGRDPKKFSFSILRLLNHDEDSEEVIRIERTWKERLHTLFPLGLNKN